MLKIEKFVGANTGGVTRGTGRIDAPYSQNTPVKPLSAAQQSGSANPPAPGKNIAATPPTTKIGR